MKSVLIAVPTAKYIEAETFKSIYDLIVPDNLEVDFKYFSGYQIDHTRNVIANSSKSYDYLLAIDSDMILPKNALERLASWDLDLVSGVYIKRQLDPIKYELYQKNAQGIVEDMQPVGDGLFEIDACGFGCVLIKTKVFDRVSQPYFCNTRYDPKAYTVSEDLYFCKQLRHAGIRLWADARVICGHIGSHVYRP